MRFQNSPRDDQIRDKLVIGLLDKELSEKHQSQSDLKLEIAVTMTRQREMVKSQRKSQTLHDLDDVRGGNRRYHTPHKTPGIKPKTGIFSVTFELKSRHEL